MSEPSRSVAEVLQAAMARHRAGDLAAAAAQYEAVLAREPRNFDALHLLGVIALQTGDAKRAIELLTLAISVYPDAHPAIHQLARACQAAGLLDDASAHFARAIELAPGNAAAREGYALVLHAQKRYAEAASQFEMLTHVPAHALAAYNNLGTTLWSLRRYDEAFAAWDRALEIDPRHPDALFNSAIGLELTGRLVPALERMQELVRQRPRQPRPYYQVGLLYHALGMREDALAAFSDALSRDENFVEARWMLAIAQLQLAYGPGERQTGDLARFDDAVAELDAWFVGPRVALADRALGTRQPFYIAYHDADLRPSLSRYGDLCARLMQAHRGGQPSTPSRSRSNGPVRVAVVSHYFFDHSVWTALLRGWCALFDPARVELHLLHTGTEDDAETAIARETSASFEGGLRTVDEWMAVLRKRAPEIVVYPEVCMDAMALRLACLRPAPIQVTTWGHPMTSGLPAMDYFVSAEAFEPPGAQANYRERLITLPGIGCYYEPLSPQASVTQSAEPPSLQRTGPRFACVGTPYKYLPQHDHLLVDIAERVGTCQFLFFVDFAPLLSRKLEDRLASAFARRGLDATRFVRFLPRQTRPAFFALLRESDVYLDTLVFSGFNTAMQAVECGLPIVTCEGRYMRGRFASGILRELGLGELVAGDGARYAELAVELATNAAYRQSIRDRIASNSPRLFRDETPVRKLEAFLFDLARRGR